MNILIPHSWLKDFLQTEASPAKIANCLSLCGPSVEKIDKIANDYIYDIEVTTNRVDMMSVMGIAREAAAILPQFNIKAKLKQDIYQPTESVPEGDPFPLKLTINHQLCPRFAAVVIKNTTVKPSPKKIQQSLEASDIRTLNNVIDISNYLMRAYGQPIHTFDLDKIKQQMILRLSKKGEKLTTLDNKVFTLLGNDIVIEDAGHRLIDLCGIMGGLNTAIDNNTKNVLLFIQTYNPQHIRHTSMALGQRSEAAQLFEKSVDPELVMPVLLQGIQLFKKLTNGEQGSQIIDIYPKPYKPKTITTSLQLIKDRLGIDISSKNVSQILNSLGFNNKFSQENFTITIPSWRAKDINLPEDIVEEVARIYGYHKLPSRLMKTAIPTNYPQEKLKLEHQIKTWLTGMGLNEIYTNSMVSETLVKQSPYSLKSHLKIKNALSEKWQYMRRSLIPSHLKTLNQNPHTKNITFFEIAHTYHSKPKSLPEEKLELIISSNKSFSHLKGIIETLFVKLHLQPQFKPKKDSAEILIKNQSVGTIGPSNLNPEVQIALLNLKPILKLAQLYPQYQPLSPHSPILEDMTFTLPAKTYLGPVINTIKKSHNLIQKVKLTKTYQKNHTFNITYQSQIQPLNDKMIAPIRKKIVTILSKKFRAKLVGKL